MPLAVAGSTHAGGVPERPLPGGGVGDHDRRAGSGGADAVMMLEHVEAAQARCGCCRRGR